jgi:anti-sigma B factor antagonist
VTGTQIIHEQADDIHVISFNVLAHDSDDQDALRAFFGDEFLDVTATDTKLVVDLKGIPSLDSSCLGPLVQRLRDFQNNEGRMALCGVQSQGLKEIFALTRFDKVFTICPDRPAALAHVSAA